MRSADAAHELASSIVTEHRFMDEITLEVTKEQLIPVLTKLKSAPFGFDVLMDLTGVDYVEPKVQTKVLYWLHNPTSLDRIRVVVFAGRDETIPSVTSLWEGANWYEREVYDLYGVHFSGHPDLKRILLPDDWKGHPLRRDHPLVEEPVAFKHGVEPKVPSEIIPHVKARRPS